MKICYLCPDLGISVDGQKGASSHIRGFVNALKQQGCELFIVTPCPVKEGTIDVPIIVIPKPQFIEGLANAADNRTFRALRHIFYNSAIESQLKEIIPKEKPDFIYERYSPFSAAEGIFARQNNIPHILEVNAPLAEQGKRYRKQALQQASELLEQEAFKQTNLLITLTRELKTWLIENGAPPEKVKVRPSGVDEKMFAIEGASYKERFANKIVLGFVGSLKQWHDIELLATIFRRLASDPKYHLLVVGDGPMLNTIQNLSKELPGRVTITGAIEQEEVPKYIRSMDIALAPYPDMDVFYFSPLKVYEYMAMGKAVIATSIGQLNTLIQHNVNGCLVPVQDVNAWIHEIQTLAACDPLRKRLGETAAKNIHENHTWTKRAQQFISIVEDTFYASC